MSKARTHYICRSCGGVQAQWLGKCPDCGTWDALDKFIEPKPLKSGSVHAAAAQQWGDAAEGSTTTAVAAATPLPEIESSDFARVATGIAEFDRVLGGGLVPGSVVLLGGDPGIGKSTLMLQAAAKLAQAGSRVLYISSEESAHQTKLRAQRLFGDENDDARSQEKLGLLAELFILADTNLARILEQARVIQPQVCIIDSIQMVFKGDVEAAPGSVTQLRRCCTDIVHVAKISGMSIVLVGHVTKDGQFAGPKLLEHLVDAVLSFEGDRHHAHRVVRGVKNRFGTTLEVGLFEMTSSGLAEVANSASLLNPEERPNAGSVVFPAMHGTRCVLVEIQALTATGFLGAAKRKTSGLDPNRLAMLIAVLEKHGGLRLADQDVFASAVGGLKVIEPGADLALCMAIAGAHLRSALSAGTAVIGEVGLGGEVRHVPQMEARIREAQRLGYRTIIAPSVSASAARMGVEMVAVRKLCEALGQLSRVG